mmetsp:Transcript_33607/g.100183  ORF Transcript_33607/g.100183 Transcript_33607/m.100183 type:complete len:361 (-) Transcript_33607:14-1096(-)
MRVSLPFSWAIIGVGAGVLAVAKPDANPDAVANPVANAKPDADERKLAGTCPRTEPEPWSNCTDVGEVMCNVGEVYGGDKYCWKNCDGKVWTDLCALPPAGGTCPETRPVSRSTCTEEVECNLGEVYGEDKHCWVACDGKEWTEYCAELKDPDDPPAGSCADAATCDECLALDGCGAWARPGGCYSQCSYDPNDPSSLNIADGSCWDGTNGGCKAAQASADDWTICAAQTANGCESCMDTDKSNNGGKCLWLSDNEGGYGECAPEQGMLCCPVAECPAKDDITTTTTTTTMTAKPAPTAGGATASSPTSKPTSTPTRIPTLRPTSGPTIEPTTPRPTPRPSPRPTPLCMLLWGNSGCLLT